LKEEQGLVKQAKMQVRGGKQATKNSPQLPSLFPSF